MKAPPNQLYLFNTLHIKFTISTQPVEDMLNWIFMFPVDCFHDC